MRRRLSSLQTIFIKILLPGFWIPVFGFVVLMSFIGSYEESDPIAKWVLLGAWVMMSAIFYWTGIRLKDVSVDDRFLYVSNYLKEIVLPLSEIRDVTENVWINTHPVTIHLRSPSEFGDKIVFMPKTRVFAFFSSHPVVEELKHLAKVSSFRW